MDKPQIIAHVQKSLNYTLFDCRWVPCSAKFVVLGSHARGTGALQIYELAHGDVCLVHEVNTGFIGCLLVPGPRFSCNTETQENCRSTSWHTDTSARFCIPKFRYSTLQQTTRHWWSPTTGFGVTNDSKLLYCDFWKYFGGNTICCSCDLTLYVYIFIYSVSVDKLWSHYLL